MVVAAGQHVVGGDVGGVQQVGQPQPGGRDDDGRGKSGEGHGCELQEKRTVRGRASSPTTLLTGGPLQHVARVLHRLAACAATLLARRAAVLRSPRRSSRLLVGIGTGPTSLVVRADVCAATTTSTTLCRRTPPRRRRRRLPGGVTTAVGAPAESTEDEYFQACHAAKTWMAEQGGDLKTQFEPYLADLQKSDSAGPAPSTRRGRSSPPDRQAAVIVAAEAASNDLCG